MNDTELAYIMIVIATNIGTYFYTKFHFIEFTIDVLTEKGYLELEDEQK